MEWEVNAHLRKMGLWPVKGRQFCGPLPVSHSDILIVGAGVFGASTAHHLSQIYPDATVTVIDRTPFPPRHAASTDISKIVRADYSSRFYMELAYEAMVAWEARAELRPFYHRTGWVNFGARGSDLAARIRANFRDRGRDPTADVGLDELRERWFGGVFRDANLEGIDGVYWNPEAGWCDAEQAVEAVLKVALRNPKVRYVVADVERLVLSEDRKRVTGVLARSGERYSAGKTILATGAWTSSLMTALEDELDIEEEDRVEMQIKAAGVCVSHFSVSDEEMKELSQMPVVIYGTEGDGQPPPDKSRLLKFVNGRSFTNTVTTASGRQITVPPDQSQSVVPESLRQ